MAELILSPIADKILGGLGSAAVKEIALLWGVNDDLDQLNETISTIKSVLLDAEEKQINSHQVRNWLRRLGGVVDDADNLMDEFNTKALRRQVMPAGSETVKQVCTFFSASNQLAFRLKMGCRIREINKKLDAISSSKAFHLEVRHEDNQAVSARRGRETHSFVRQEEVIGRDEDRVEIVKLLLEQGELEENVSVIPIMGMGGLGKTTLAQTAFNEETVQQHFDLKMWVCVSEYFDLKLIVQQIIKSATNNNNLKDNDSMDRLQKELQKLLNGKKYLLVLDDVWEEKHEKWLMLKGLLLSGSQGSRILVTTRSKKVAEITGSIQPYQLGILDKEKSWSLFEKMAFKQKEEERDPKIVDIGRQIVERCGGVPLAIRAIGGMLFFKSSESEWLSFYKGFSGISREKEDDILSTLKLSYDHLTPHLKRCFAYCRLFPKDYRIRVQTLVKHWMAQGLLELQDPSDDQCLEDVGYGYFVELLGRSFFQEVEVDHWGAVETCKMHDLMHDLAMKVAGTECATVSLNSGGNIGKDTRHVSFDFNINSPKKISSSLVQVRKIRTVLLLDQWSWKNKWGKSTSDALGSNFKLTRTLDLHRSGITMLPKSVGSFKHLRYLDLSDNNDIKMLPNSISNLVNLQTLRLNGCSSLRELPRDLKKLVNLRHLEIDGCDEVTHMPRGLSQLTNLQTLSRYILSKSNDVVMINGGELKELMGLNNLKGKLKILNLEHGNDAARDYESANLKDKQYLRSLRLKWISDDEGTEAPVGYEKSLEALQPHQNLQELTLYNYGGVKFSSWLSSLTNLVSLKLNSCEKCQYLLPLNQFPRLETLKLNCLPCLEYINGEEEDLLLSSTIILPSLRVLWLWDLPNLKGWWREVVSGELLPCFPPCLSELYIWDCPQLSCMPLYPHLEERLVLQNTRLKPLEQTVLVLESRKCSTSTTGTEIPTTTSSSFSPLSKLTDLRFYGIGEDLQCLPEWFKSLTCLKRLDIRECSKLKDLSPGIQHLTSLEELEIGNCEELEIEEMIPLVNNGRLRSLYLTGSHKLTSLPEGLQHLTSLRCLWIANWKNLETIPEWIGNLNSLETLELGKCPKLRALPEGVRSLTCLKTLHLVDCPELRALPEGIRSLTCLKTLEIWDCPMLLKRCQSPIGEDWPKIAHIPRLDLGLDPNRNDDVENPTRDEHTTSLDKIKACSSSFLFKNFGLCMQ